MVKRGIQDFIVVWFFLFSVNPSFGCTEAGRTEGQQQVSFRFLDFACASLPGLPSSGLPILMGSLLMLLLLLLLPPPVQPQYEDACRWQVALNKYETLGMGGEKFFLQQPVSIIDKFFRKLVDSPIDHKENYVGFPYYMKINFTCPGETPEAFVRGGFLKGMIPRVRVTFYPPVNFRRWRTERLQIQMEGAPFQIRAQCGPYTICNVNWYTPMPMKNGSVMMEVEIISNNQGEIISNGKFMININGFLKKEKDKLSFSLGEEVSSIMHRHFLKAPSRPMWATMDQAPVLILGGIPNEKMVLISDSSFKDFSLVELNIDSCWLGTLQCPQEEFTASIFDAIATESVLFIRQNQLVYYFTGNYSHLPGKATDSWVRVLNKRCIKKLCPVELHSNGSEYIVAVAGGNEEGFFHFGTITDATVTFKQFPVSSSICDIFKAPVCRIHWVTYNTEEHKFLLLMEMGQSNQATFKIFEYIVLPKGSNIDAINLLFTIPRYIPASINKDFVMLLAMEKYTAYPLVPKGLFYNPFSHMLFIWGNAILQSFDNIDFIYLSKFPKESTVKYTTSSYHGEMIFVTENEEIWLVFEKSFEIRRLYPSSGWQIVFSLSKMRGLNWYTDNETSVSVFFDSMGLQQLVYQINKKGEGKLKKRRVPVEEIMMYRVLSKTATEVSEQSPTINFLTNCPYQRLKLYKLPNLQQMTRLERYHAKAPHVSSELAFHNKISLAIYQGLVYHLLWLHSKYNKPYADPVHDPTWRWWKDKKQHKAFYFYRASNFQNVYGIHIDMDGYEKLYKEKATGLPKYMYLDKGDTYHFSFFLFIHKASWKNINMLAKSHVQPAILLSHPQCVRGSLRAQPFINRNAILFTLTITDTGRCFNQSISGHNLMKTAVHLKIIDAPWKCFRRSRFGYIMQGNRQIPTFIGCPPGKRLAFDITLTLRHNKKTNKRYFDCVHPDPEMPCFLFSDPFHPFFLIQDMVTGESGSFNGSYVLKVIGGGTSLDNIVDYSEEDIIRYNSPNDTSESLIWIVRDKRKQSQTFRILNYNSPGIEWLCLPNSPCHDIIPTSIYSPEFYFKIMVSNRGVDTSTYCDYQVTFLLHIHGLPLSRRRALFFVWISLCVCLGVVFLYLLSFFLWPHLKNGWMKLKAKFTDLITTESFYTYTSASTLPSRISSKISTSEKTSAKKKVKKTT
ncbi:cation channel sperm-associated auxiliary subunit gamma isoform X1 [Antechinus flavipes]|uniref:cation channel sperm-associated auxiliary subunit gamma isoform X1 n=1 Tax=Antechinus flavipes TaxID=38775 RepID=UPI0022362D26|nr:cation channel sperm-associated auxiliary subunit gamma isoform X1 [Antechinus flavipes]